MGLWAWIWVNRAFNFIAFYCRTLLEATGMRPFYMVVVLAAIVFRLLVVPLVGPALVSVGSDVYSKTKANLARDRQKPGLVKRD